MDPIVIFRWIFIAWVVFVTMVLLILKLKCPHMFRLPKKPEKCQKCGGSEFLPKYSWGQKINPSKSGRYFLGGAVAFKCRDCGHEIKVKKGEGMFAFGNRQEPHA